MKTTEIDDMYEEFERILTKKFPPEKYGEDGDLEVLVHIVGQLREAAKLTEKAFVAGRSKTSWEQFKKDYNLEL